MVLIFERREGGKEDKTEERMKRKMTLEGTRV